MAENSKIEWTDHTFNPWIGCTKVSEGCKFCYAETLMDKRYKKVQWGPQGKRIKTSSANWKLPLKWDKEAARSGVRARVFCASLADVFEEKLDQPEMNLWRNELFKLIDITPNLDWLLLTKRPENVLRLTDESLNIGKHLISEISVFAYYENAKNIWIGTSVEDQKTADQRIPELLTIPAKVRFLSCEPLLEAVNLDYVKLWHDRGLTEYVDFLTGQTWQESNIFGGSKDYEYLKNYGHSEPRIHWVIVGGESSTKARPFNIEWAKELINQCETAQVPIFIKQLGGNLSDEDITFCSHNSGQYMHDSKGGNPDEWPLELRIREFPV